MEDRTLWTIVAFFLIFYVVLNILENIYDGRFKAACDEAGGIAVITSRKDHCLNPSSFIQLKDYKL